MKKIFSCVWLQPIYSTNICTLENVFYFSIPNGYELEQIQIIQNMEIGNVLILDGASHFITRVK